MRLRQAGQFAFARQEAMAVAFVSGLVLGGLYDLVATVIEATR